MCEGWRCKCCVRVCVQTHARALADRILVLEEDNQMMRDFVHTFAELEKNGDEVDLDASFPRAIDDADGNTDEEDGGSYYGVLEESADEGTDDDDEDDNDEDDDDGGGDNDAGEGNEEDDLDNESD